MFSDENIPNGVDILWMERNDEIQWNGLERMLKMDGWIPVDLYVCVFDGVYCLLVSGSGFSSPLAFFLSFFLSLILRTRTRTRSDLLVYGAVQCNAMLCYALEVRNTKYGMRNTIYDIRGNSIGKEDSWDGERNESEKCSEEEN